MMSPAVIPCPKCGVPLPADAPQGLCPRCLGAINLDTHTVLTDAAGETAQPPFLPADLAPHFPLLEILECRGRGGMGVVYKAQQKSLNRVVALKLLAPERVQDAKFGERFAREAQALARLNHPNIVTVHDFGEVGGFFYLLMEFVDGMNLRQILRSRTMTTQEALAIVPPVCEALQYAHDRGVVHRDIKPENLLLDRDGRVKIADFGIARMVGEPGTNTGLTETQPVGTPQYMAPEQRDAPQSADHRADIYSLGVVLYELLTGELPDDKFQPPSRKVSIDVRLDEVVLRALAKNPSSRFQHASQVRSEMETILLTPGPLSNANSSAEQREAGHASQSLAGAASIETDQPVNTSLMKNLVLSGLALAAAGTFLVIQYRGEAGLRREIQALNAQAVEAELLRQENDSLSQDVEHAPGTLATKQLADLHRLRSEIPRLRETANQLAISNRLNPDPSRTASPGTTQSDAIAPADPPRPEPEFTYSTEYRMPLRKSISPRLSYAYEMAGRQNNIDEVKKVLDENPDFIREPVGSTGATLLHTAAYNARKDIVEELLRRNADVNAQSLVGHTPLYNAVDRGTKDIVQLLIQHGANVSIPANNGVTPLKRALAIGRTEVAEMLRAAGARE